jgi:hypothetical protein
LTEERLRKLAEEALTQRYSYAVIESPPGARTSKRRPATREVRAMAEALLQFLDRAQGRL